MRDTRVPGPKTTHVRLRSPSVYHLYAYLLIYGQIDSNYCVEEDWLADCNAAAAAVVDDVGTAAAAAAATVFVGGGGNGMAGTSKANGTRRPSFIGRGNRG